MPIIAIDPGNVQSGYCVIDQKTLRPLEFGKIDNEELLKKLEAEQKKRRDELMDKGNEILAALGKE